MSKGTRYVTTPIYYVNDRPHIGHVYTTTLCDVYARAMRLLGHETFFLTGTDEHGLKVEQSASERGITPQELADENAAAFRHAMELFGLTHDDFIRTTDESHERQVGAFVKRLVDQGDVYLGTFEGWYDAGQEEYHTETSAAACDYTSPVNGQPLTRASEQNYYFRLSAYQERLESLFANQSDFVLPEARRNEVLGRLREGLQDVPVSRTNFTWGIPMPDDEAHVIYVWIDALFNYVTALGLGDGDGQRHADRSHYWPATFHVIGKEILWFHAVIWPAVLMALDLPMPRGIVAHSFWISEGKKMSKSLGNFIDLETIEEYVGRYGMDAWRYYLVTQGPLGATDANFASSKFHEIYTAHLVNTVGNSASRVLAMVGKYFDGIMPTEAPGGSPLAIGEHDWPARCAAATEHWQTSMERFAIDAAIGAGLSLIRDVDAFINETEPYKIAKDDDRRDELGAILYQCAETLRIASVLLSSVIPKGAVALWDAMGLEDAGTFSERVAWGGLPPGTAVTKVAPYPRIELKPA